jgi:hypothetical protein
VRFSGTSDPRTGIRTARPRGPQAHATVIAHGAEDKLMERQVPNEYPEYKKRTKALILFLW